ncbi:MAG: phosphoribosylformimino-5-aminoimidazole carboxamide ribotide isomerase [Roseburia sp.]|nr:phosphoribosylformimino-5-aminoimidazole carboxamide ribotide isomerase [Roseburia sp.]
MKFRPCIDIHNGKVKQIVGGSLQDAGNHARENFVSEMKAADYAKLYREKGLQGGHVILLNPAGSEYYDADVRQAEGAFREYPGGLQAGGGITPGNAGKFLEAGASHVIVTSYVFSGGEIHFERLRELNRQVGKEHLVLDLSCRERDGVYYIVTDRWQKFTRQPLDEALMRELSSYCDEFLVHGVNVEGTGGGIDRGLVEILAKCTEIPVTYAGGIGTYEDLEMLRKISGGKIDFTIGSALDLFGGVLEMDEIITNFND